ncbi:MAG: AEC family transporter [Dehalococcoidales bacterium]|nr:AEC family transporter [Dehalococcoidales bacterium]
MEIFGIVLQSVLVLLGIGVIGFWITRRNILPENVLGFLSTLATDIALPATVFASIMINFNPAEFPNWWQLPLWWLLFTGIIFAMSMAFRYISRKETRAEFTISLFFQNGLFFPLIILSGIFGTDTPYIAILFIFMMLHPTLFFSTYPFFFKKAPGQAVRWQRVINPVLIATVLAILIQAVDIERFFPGFLLDIFKILGAMALPLVMIILGGSLYLDFQQKGRFYLGEISKFIIVKNLVFPLVIIGVLLLLRPTYNIALMFFLQAVVPPVTAAPILTERAGGNKAVVTQFVFASFIASMLTIPALFLLFNHYFPMP